MQWNRDTAMALNKEIQVQGFILGNAPGLWVLKCLKLQGKHPERICAVSITQREAAVKQIPLVLDSASTSQILPGEGCEFVKMVQSNARFGELGNFSSFYSLCREHQAEPSSPCFAAHFKGAAWAKRTRWGWHLAMEPLPSHCCSVAGRKMMCCKCQVLSEM